MPVFRPLALAVAALLPFGAAAENLLENASFEQPAIKGRTPETKGANPSLVEPTGWLHFESLDTTGRIVVGLSDELARTGKQSIYVDFNKAEQARAAFLIGGPVKVTPGAEYRISLWGRMDPKRPLTLAHARPMLRVEIEFYAADEETQIGETELRTQMIPGGARRLLFETANWREYFTDVRAPEESALMKLTFRWESPGEKGFADGLIYFDDAVVEQVSAPAPAAPNGGTPAPAAAPASPAPAAPAVPGGAAK